MTWCLVVKRTKYGTAHTSRARSWTAEKDPDIIVCESVERQLEQLMAPKARYVVEMTVEARVRRSVYAMLDWELVAKLASIPVENLRNIWECEFQSGVAAFYKEAGHISWKQRKISREIVERIELKKERELCLSKDSSPESLPTSSVEQQDETQTSR